MLPWNIKYASRVSAGVDVNGNSQRFGKKRGERERGWISFGKVLAPIWQCDGCFDGLYAI